jgi:hypothetical protein
LHGKSKRWKHIQQRRMFMIVANNTLPVRVR